MVAERFRFDLGYDADIAGRDLLAARARQAGRLAKLWASHPGELTKAVEAWSWRLRGTHERPQDDGATLTDRVQQLEQDGRARWLGSSLHRQPGGRARRTPGAPSGGCSGGSTRACPRSRAWSPVTSTPCSVPTGWSCWPSTPSAVGSAPRP